MKRARKLTVGSAAVVAVAVVSVGAEAVAVAADVPVAEGVAVAAIVAAVADEIAAHAGNTNLLIVVERRGRVSASLSFCPNRRHADTCAQASNVPV